MLDIPQEVITAFAPEAAQRLGKKPSELSKEEVVLNSRLIYNVTYRERFFNSTDNPRLARPIRRDKIRLYHFTKEFYLDSIRQHGLRRGDVPVHVMPDLMPSPDDFNNAVWLSDNLDVTVQRWGGTKCQMRIEVVLDAKDANLWLWNDLATFLGVDETTRKALHLSGGNEREWWVYVNDPISPTCFRSIDSLVGKRQRPDEVIGVTRPKERIPPKRL